MDAIREFVERTVDAQLLVSVAVMSILANVILLVVAYSIYLERKISAYIQDRIGPNRVGFDFGLPFLKVLSTKGPLKGLWGLGQPLADGIKFLIKEDFTPSGVDKALFTLAPMLIIVPALIGFVIIPWGGLWQTPDLWTPFGTVEGALVNVTVADINVGIIYLLAVASVGVYGVTLGGWASNSKYSFLGGLRATAQMISYEIPLGLSLLAALLLFGTVRPHEMVEQQVADGWLVLAQPLACVLFFLAILAEANRAPFDNAEAEQELVGGYHTEYSSMRFALFFLAEYAHMVTSSAFLVLLFFGGYHLPLGWLGLGSDHWLSPENVTFLGVLAKVVVYFAKVVLVICFMMLIRWTLPRLRYDQVMMLGWQTLIPVSLAVVVATSVMVYLGWTPSGLADSMGLLSWVPMFAVNAALLASVYAVQTVLPRSTRNRRLGLYGSRFASPEGDVGAAAPTDPMALEDRPVQGTAPAVG